MHSKIFNLYFGKVRNKGNNIIPEDYFQVAKELEGKKVATLSLKENVMDFVKLHYGDEVTEIEYSPSPLRDYFHLCTEELSHSELGKLYFDVMSKPFKGTELLDLIQKEKGSQAVANFLFSAKYNYFFKISIRDYEFYNPVPFKFFIFLEHKLFMPKSSQEMLFYKKLISPRNYGKFVALNTGKLERARDSYVRYLNHFFGTEGNPTRYKFQPEFIKYVSRRLVMKDKLQTLDEWLTIHKMEPIQYYTCFTIKTDKVIPRIALICKLTGIKQSRFLFNALILTLERYIANPHYGELGYGNPSRTVAIQSSKFLKDTEDSPSF